jgi:AAA15 family ATPase/GTPase
LFTALPYLFDVLESGGVLVIDEIENGLHLSLAREIVSLFMDETTNPNHAQLICTSHQPLLLDGEFRRDQVWIANKDAFGKSNLCRLSDYKTSRAKVNLTNRILEGAFGCNPDVFFK